MGRVRNPMKQVNALLCLALLALVGCGASENETATLNPDRSAPTADETPGAVSSDAPPSTAASSAAASAPECKDIEKTAPGTCKPSGAGPAAPKP
jgi:hypothetical protein